MRRLTKELRDLHTRGVPGVKVEPRDGNVFFWDAIVDGPVGTVYEGGHFKVELEFPQEYPMKPPSVRFCTKIYHPNFFDIPGPNLDSRVLAQWAPSVMVKRLFEELLDIMANPDPHHPADYMLAGLYIESRAAFDETARRWTEEYAK